MKIKKVEIYYILLMSAALLAGLARNIVFGRLMSPEEMGYYSIMLTVSTYGMLFQFGVINGLGRELPFELGRNNITHASILVGDSIKMLALLQIVSFLIYTLIIINIPFTDSQMPNVLILGGVLALSMPFVQLVMLRLRSEQRVIAFSIAQVASSVSILIIGAISIKQLSYYGAVVSIIVINIAIYFIATIGYLDKVKYRRFDSTNIKHLIKIGLPLMLSSTLFSLLMGMDRIFLIKYFPVEKIGIYQIGLIPLVLGTATSGIISQYISPKLLYRMGQGSSIAYVFTYARRVSLIVILMMGAFIPLVSYISKFIIVRWLPAYIDSGELIVVFYIGAIFIAANIIGIVFNAANKQLLQLYLGIIIVFISFICYTIISIYKLPIIWYAYANTSVQILYFLVSYLMCLQIVRKSSQ